MQTRHLSSSTFCVERSDGSDRRQLVASLASGLLLLAACSDDGPAAANMAGSGGASAAAGSGGMSSLGNGGASAAGNGGASGNGASGSGGSSGGGITDNPEFGFKVPCPPPAQALLLDFSPDGAVGSPGADAGGADAAAPAPARDATFGTFGVSLAGGTYSYPADGMWPIGSDVSQGNWHLTGEVGTYSGFGIYIGGCNVLDASAYDGISFTLSGSVAMGNTLTMNVATSADDVSHVWLNTIAMPPPATPAGVNSGRCIPATANQYDGSCASPAVSVPVTAEPATVTVLWSQLTGGRPATGVDPAEITGISWSFPPPPSAGDPALAMPYTVDIAIDDIAFVVSP